MAIRKITPRSILSGALTENLNIDSGTLYVDTSANRVGVATTSPTTALSVVGSANITSTSSNSFKVRNTVAGTSALSQISLGNDTDADLLYIQAFSTTYTTAGVAIQNGAVINGEGVGGLNLAATQAPIRFFSGGDTERMRLDSNGHLGLGVTPSATWSLGGGKALQLPSGSLLSYSTTDLHIAQNSFFNGTNWVYTNTGTATLQSQLSGEFQWSSVASGSAGSTSSFTRRMTLSASGKLGLGNSNPSQLLHLEVSSGDIYQQIQSGANLVYVGYETSRDVGVIQSNNALTFDMGNSYIERMRLDTSGNLGLGVTPSPYDSVFKALDVGQAGNGISGNSGTTQITQGVYYNSGYKYSVTASAVGRYEINVGVHKWNIAPSGTATNPITFTQAMTLDASGNLLINTTANANSAKLKSKVSAGAVGFEVTDEATSDFVVVPAVSASVCKIGPTAGALAIQTAGTERMRLTSAGNLGIGTASPNYTLQLNSGASNSTYLQITHADAGTANTDGLIIGLATGASPDAYIAQKENAPLIFQTNATERMRIDSSGNVGIGTTSPAFLTEIVGGATTVETTLLQIRSNAGGIGTGSTIAFCNSTTAAAGSGRVELAAIRTTSSGGSLVIRTGDDSGNIQERMRIDSSGNLLVGRTSHGSYTQKLNLLQSSASQGGIQSWCDSATFSGTAITARASRNTTNNSFTFFQCSTDGVGDKLYIFDSGNVYNTTGTYGTLSDIKLKENIVDTTSKLNDVMALKVRNFNLKSEPELKQIGFIAQELETIFPSMVEETLDQTKIVKTTVLIPILVKAIQEQQALIESLTTRLTALENK